MTNFELFEKHLQQKLNPEETAVFIQRMKDDPVFVADFNQYRLIESDMQQWQKVESEREKLKKTLYNVTGKPGKESRVIPLRIFMWRAAALLVVALSLWLLFKPSGAKSDRKLYAQYARAETFSLERGNETDSLWGKASSLFYDKKYTEAIVPLKQIIDSGKDSLQKAAVYFGFCYMQSGDNEEAEKILNKTRNLKNEVGEQAQWYLALLYLKTGRKDECLKMLKKISSSSGYGNKATKLLKELR
jgi:tetratricopeptide (TPR) repeat protein